MSNLVVVIVDSDLSAVDDQWTVALHPLPKSAETILLSSRSDGAWSAFKHRPMLVIIDREGVDRGLARQFFSGPAEDGDGRVNLESFLDVERPPIVILNHDGHERNLGEGHFADYACKQHDATSMTNALCHLFPRR
ncbi:MAG: hypothetical protein WCV92_01510 [Candidatus Buchananbacteria bacterium]